MPVDVADFRKSVYDVVSSIPYGMVTTYGQVAWLVGRPCHARLVGRVLREASESLRVPCHRVVNSQGRTAPHWAAQRALLEAEGVKFKSNGCVDIKEHLWMLG